VRDAGLVANDTSEPSSLRALFVLVFPLPGDVTRAGPSYFAPVRNGLIAALAAVIVLLPSTAVASSRISMSPAEATLLQEMNGARQQAGLVPLAFNQSLEDAARAHSREMLSTNTFAHGAFANRMARYHVPGVVAGENLAWGTGYRASARAIVDAWLQSPEHRANLLRPSFRLVGIGSLDGTFQGSPAARVVTADFAGS
jgi:uncharacterized protein YkwD